MSWYLHQSSCVVWFFLLGEPRVPFWQFKILYVTVLSLATGWSQVLPKFEPFSSGFIAIFFKFKNLWTQFWMEWVRFHVHTTHSPMLKIMWMQSLSDSTSHGPLFWYITSSLRLYPTYKWIMLEEHKSFPPWHYFCVILISVGLNSLLLCCCALWRHHIKGCFNPPIFFFSFFVLVSGHVWLL
jgi:hypothetical protein